MELRPCPFCGKDEVYVQYTDDYLEWGVYCRTCKAQIYSFPTESEAIKAWNTRTPHTNKKCSKEHGIECWHGNYCRECGEKFHSNEEEG